MKRGCKALTHLLAVALFSVSACHAKKSTADNNTAPFEKKVDIGGRSLFIACTAAVRQKPTVIFEAGMNNTSATWDNIRAEIAKFARGQGRFGKERSIRPEQNDRSERG